MGAHVAWPQQGRPGTSSASAPVALGIVRLPLIHGVKVLQDHVRDGARPSRGRLPPTAAAAAAAAADADGARAAAAAAAAAASNV